MNQAFFFQTQEIPDSSPIFNQLKEQKIFFSHFLVDQTYYLFVYSQTDIQLDIISQSVKLIEELDSKQRKIRSLRGFFLYALEILEKGEESDILETNLQPFFWRKVKTIIRQNKKGALLEFLFGNDLDNKSVNQDSNLLLKNAIVNLQNQVNYLQQKVNSLENQTNHFKNALSVTLEASRDTKSIQQSDYSLEAETPSYLQGNNQRAHSEIKQVAKLDSNIISEDSTIDFKTSERSEHYSIISNEDKGFNVSNFITLSQIPEQEKN